MLPRRLSETSLIDCPSNLKYATVDINNKSLRDSFEKYQRIFLYFILFLILLYFLASCRVMKRNDHTVSERNFNTDSANHFQMVRPQADGTLLLRAEVGRAIGPKIKYMPNLRVFGYFTSSDSVEWEVNVVKSGMYDVLLEWSISDEEAGKAYVFVAGDQKVTGTVLSTGSFYTHKTQKVGQISLSPGIQKMIFKAATNFDKGELIDLRGVWLQPAKN